MKAYFERAVSFCPGEEILPEHLFPKNWGTEETEVDPTPPNLEKVIVNALANQSPEALQATLEKMVIAETLKRAKGVHAYAAKQLNMDPKTLRTKITKYGLDHSRS